MAVSDGSPVNAAVTNAAFISRTADSDTIAVVGLKNSGSGSDVNNAQQAINDNISDISDLQGEVRQNNFTATSAPSTSNDDTEGYSVGSRWFDTTSDISYDCMDASTGAAVWLESASAAGATILNNFGAAVDPVATDDSGSGYAVGSQWINTTLDRIFQCVDATAAAAIWKRIDKMQLTVAKNLFFDFGSTTVDDTAWVELDADIGSDEVVEIYLQHQSGSTLRLATGAAASETEVLKIIPGGYDAGIPLQVAANSRLSIRVETGQADITGGLLIVNLMKEV